MKQDIDSMSKNAFKELEESIFTALKSYSNVHRGTGHFSQVTTHLYEQAKTIVLDYLQLKSSQYAVIYCSSRQTQRLASQIAQDDYIILSSSDFGLRLGVNALVVKKKSLSQCHPFHVGGGTARLMSKDWVVWAKSSDKFEAGTPPIINVIAFAKALQMIQRSGKDIFINPEPEEFTVSEILYRDELEKFSGKELLTELRKTLIGSGSQVPTAKGLRTFINLDNSASTRTFIPVWKAFQQAYRQPESIKQEIIQEGRFICAEFLNAPQSDYEVIFTSNTTEAINLAAESLSKEFENGTESVILNTLLEHSSNDLPWRMIPNASIIRLSVNSEGFVGLKELETILQEYNQDEKHGKKRIRLLAVSGASNVLGSCNNLEEISRIAHQYSARILVDAAQLVAHLKVDTKKCRIDYLAFSAHKVYAPFGSGALVAKKGLLQFSANEMELIKSSGEENAGGIAALGKALLLLQRIGMDLIYTKEQALTARALLGLAQISHLEIYGVKHPELPGFSDKIGVIAFALKNKMATQVGKELALQGGIGVRTGCHCAHIAVKHILKVGPGLEKFQKLIVSLFPKLSLPGVVRISFGLENTEEDVDSLIQVLTEIADKSESSKKKEIKQQMNDFVREVAERVYN